VAAPLLTGGMSSLVGSIVAFEHRNRAYSLDIFTYNLAGIIGPRMTALIAGWLGGLAAAWVLVAFAVSAAALVLQLRLLQSDRHPRRAMDDTRRRLDGIAVFWQSRRLASATIASSLGSAGMAAIPLAIVAMADGHWSDGWTAAALSAAGAGEAIGSITYARWPFGTGDPARTNLLCQVAWAAPLILLLVTMDPAFAVAALAISGYWYGPMSAAVFMVRDEAAGNESRTQVFTLAASLKMTVAAGGAAVAGMLAGQGAPAVVWFVLACDVVGLAAGAAILGQFWQRFLPGQGTEIAGSPGMGDPASSGQGGD